MAVKQKPQTIIVTGMSGAGKSTALKTLEDMGFEAVDNLPLRFLPPLLADHDGMPMVLGVDVRSRNFDTSFFIKKVIPALKKKDPNAQVLFLDAEDEVLRRRFNETRRKHPLAQDRQVRDGIAQERALLADLKKQADIVLDSSEFSIPDLRRWMKQHYGNKDHSFTAQITSFSYRYGLPRDADLVFDARFLKNPHYDPKLREETGQQPEVVEYIQTDKSYAAFTKNLHTMLEQLLPRYVDEGKSYLTIAIGCTGGKHRSVAVAEELAKFLKTKSYKVNLQHRDIHL